MTRAPSAAASTLGPFGPRLLQTHSATGALASAGTPPGSQPQVVQASLLAVGLSRHGKLRWRNQLRKSSPSYAKLQTATALQGVSPLISAYALAVSGGGAGA